MLLGLRQCDLTGLPLTIFQQLTETDRRKLDNMLERGVAEAGGFEEELHAMRAGNSKAEIESFSAATAHSVTQWLLSRLQLRDEAVEEHNLNF